MRYVIKIAYDGTNYCGWQIQINGVSVQQRLQEAISSAFGINTNVVASGRTDSGVHALGQICHFDAEISVPPYAVVRAINSKLPDDISVLDCALADGDFDSNKSAKKKTYCYRFYFSPVRNPLRDRHALYINGEADIKKLNEAANLFIGEHDFKAYCASRSQVKTTVRVIYNAVFEYEATPFGQNVVFRVTGGGFLYNMVRTMAGTCLDCALGRIDKAQILASLETGDRNLVGKTLAARGLTLESVDYGKKLFN